MLFLLWLQGIVGQAGGNPVSELSSIVAAALQPYTGDLAALAQGIAPQAILQEARSAQVLCLLCCPHRDEKCCTACRCTCATIAANIIATR